jgi:hypothetical protein
MMKRPGAPRGPAAGPHGSASPTPRAAEARALAAGSRRVFPRRHRAPQAPCATSPPHATPLCCRSLHAPPSMTTAWPPVPRRAPRAASFNRQFRPCSLRETAETAQFVNVGNLGHRGGAPEPPRGLRRSPGERLRTLNQKKTRPDLLFGESCSIVESLCDPERGEHRTTGFAACAVCAADASVFGTQGRRYLSAHVRG